MGGKVRQFETGAVRDDDSQKNDYEAFLHPLIIEAYGDYMRTHTTQSDGQIRPGDNWQKGIPKNAYMKSLWRHFLDLWKIHRGIKVFDSKKGHEVTIEEASCAILFNVMGYLFEEIKPRALKNPL